MKCWKSSVWRVISQPYWRPKLGQNLPRLGALDPPTSNGTRAQNLAFLSTRGQDQMIQGLTLQKCRLFLSLRSMCHFLFPPKWVVGLCGPWTTLYVGFFQNFISPPQTTSQAEKLRHLSFSPAPTLSHNIFAQSRSFLTLFFDDHEVHGNAFWRPPFWSDLDENPLT